MANFLRTFTDPIKYGYATGRIRVLETRMFSQQRLERLIEAEEREEQLRIIAETDYGSYISDLTREEIETGLDRYLLNLYKFLSEITAEPDIINFFRLRHDFHNLRVILKAELVKSSEGLVNLGLLDIEMAKEAVSTRNLSLLPDLYQVAVEQALKRYEETKDPQIIDIEIDKGLYSELSKISWRLKNNWLKRLVATMIDLANLKTVIRASKHGKDIDFLKIALISGGLVEEVLWLALYNQSVESYLLWLARYNYSFVIEKARYEGGINLTKLERAVDEYLVEQIAEAKYIAVGLEPIFSYIQAKELENKALRIVLLGKASNISTDKIRERLRDLWLK
jgi:V/A-type H+-transporting ATPase subunit C